MKKIFALMLTVMLLISGAMAEENVPYIEKYGIRTCDIGEIYGIRLNDGFVFFDDATITAYPCDISYEIISDEVVDGKRQLSVRMSAGIYEVPYVGPNTTICVYYALYDYYTGNQFYIESELDAVDPAWADFTVEYGGNTWEISARAITSLEYTTSSVAFVFDYEIIMDADYDGLLFCNAPIYDYVDYADFVAQMEANANTGLPLIEDLGDLAYECVYIRAK